MSTSSFAGSPELRAGGGGGDTETPLRGTARPTWTSREHWDETFGNEQRDEALVLRTDGPRKDEDRPRLLPLTHSGLRRTLDLRSARQASLVERLETKSCTFQVNGGSAPDACVEPASVRPGPVRKEGKISTDVNHEPRLATNLTNPCSRAQELNGPLIPPSVSQSRSCPGSLTGTRKDIEQNVRFENPPRCWDTSGSPGAMLSSTMVSVLAPPWSSRPRRTKRFDETDNPAENHEHGFRSIQSRRGIGLDIPRSVSFLDTRRNTVDWSAKSDPSSLDFESKRKMTQTVSLDLSGTSPSPSSLSPWSPLLLDPNEQRSPQTGQQKHHQERLSSLNSKPTTSTLLLSIRRLNSNNTNANTSFVFPEVSFSSPGHQNRKLLPPHLSQSSFNNNEPERPRTLLSPSSVYQRTTKTGPVLSPASSAHGDGSFGLSHLSPASSKNTEERQHFSYDHPALVKMRSLPRRTTLTNTSWWQQVSQEVGTKDEPDADNRRRVVRDNNNAVVCKGNMNLAARMQPPESKRINSERRDSNGDNRELQRTQSMPDCLPTSKMSRAPPQLTLRHAMDPNKRDVSHTSFTEHLTEKQPRTLNPPTDGSSRSKPGISPTSPFGQPPPKSTFSFQAPVSSKAGAQTSDFSNKANFSPLGFERSYACLPKPFRSKTESSLVSKVEPFTRKKGAPRSPSTLSSCLLTPPATPGSPSPRSETATLKVKGILTNSPENKPKKPSLKVEKKRERRVTWGDSADVQCSEPDSPSPPRPPQSAPSSVSSLRTESPEGRSSPVCSSDNKAFSTEVGRGEKCRSLSSDSAEREENKAACEALNLDQAAPPSLPADFSSGFKLRYSAPPYSTLVSSRQTQGEKKAVFSLSHAPQTSSNADLHVPLLTSRASQPFSFQRANATQESPAHGLLDADTANNNHIKEFTNNQIQFLDNRVQVKSESLSGDDGHTSSSTFVTETIVYSIKCKGEPRSSTPKCLQQSLSVLVSAETEVQPGGRLDPSSDCESSNGSMKESVGRNKSCSADVGDERSPKKGRGPPKSSALSRSESERVGRSYKVDQMFSKLRQKFSKRSDDDSAFPWKWRRNSQTPSVSGTSDVSDNSADGTRSAEKKVASEDAKTEEAKKPAENRYAIVPALAFGETKAEKDFPDWTEKSTQGDEDEQKPESQVHLTVHSPDAVPSAAFLTQCRKSASSPRSPFSPFASLSPVSPFSSPDGTDDSVFYSPKPRRRRDSSSPCEPREEISLGGSRRRRASTGPPSSSPGTDASSYADLKYGIEPGKSFSVSSVLSSRPSGPGRISTGSRFMSVGDLSQTASPASGHGGDLYQGSLPPDWTGDFCSLPVYGVHVSDFPCDSSKMRSRSLPRSLTRRLANWSSGVPPLPSASAAPSKQARLRAPGVNICQLDWDAEGPPTPPPTPPLSPVSKRMSRPPSLSPGADGQASRGHLPSRSYRSSLSTFDESSDSSSDTTTDDEYYLEEGKETEL
ncbi:uncharacterized protein zmp:0000000991 [Kryptolebias marmoratus]|uniref:uncharacterized protein zmp:0000000991 n=1 Tax=Kryptolebias marmoratus TaxID=37003 RepID=UPI000D52FBE6|nr:uncharacterized protein zmp:0000000991 [Kryptolebias marmoratus]